VTHLQKKSLAPNNGLKFTHKIFVVGKLTHYNNHIEQLSSVRYCTV